MEIEVKGRGGIFSHLSEDVRAGVIVFLVAVPLCLGISVACKAPLMSGIIAGAIGGIVVGLLGGSQLGVSGPAAGLVTIVLAAQATLGSFEGLLLATVLAGVFQVLMGLLRAGTIAYYVPSAVIKGMLAAIGVIIILKQLPHAFGDDLVPEGDLEFFQADGENTLSELVTMLSKIQPGSLIITALGLLTLVVWDLKSVATKQFFKVVPGPLVVVVMGILLQVSFPVFLPAWSLDAEHLVHVDASNMANWFSLPDFSLISNSQVWIVALTIAGVASVESLLCAEATDKLDPEKRLTPMNRELWAQGVGNIFSGLVGGLPVTQVIVRSSANIQSGAKTRLSAIVHGLLIVLSVMVFPFLLNMIPYASLAAILIMVGYKLAKPALFKAMYQKGKSQFLPFLTTVIAILFTDLLVGIGIGMIVGILSILYRNFQIPFFFRADKTAEGKAQYRIVLSEVVSFLNKGNISDTFRAIPAGSVVVIDGSRAAYIDPDVKEVIQDFIDAAPSRDIQVEYLIHHQDQPERFTSKGQIQNTIDAMESTLATDLSSPTNH